MGSGVILLVLCCLLSSQAATQDAIRDGRVGDGSWSWKWTDGNTCPCAGEWRNAAVPAGEGPNTDFVYLGRVHHFDNLLPATVQTNNDTHPALYVYQGTIFSTKTYEVLCGEGVAWQVVHDSNSSKPFPAAALSFGVGDNEVYACRYASLGSAVGTVDPDSHVCSFPFSAQSSRPWYVGVESTADYDLLIEP